MILKIFRQENAILPEYAHPGDAGMDLRAVEEMCIVPGATALVKTGLYMVVPEGFEAQVRPRSGLALKHSVTVLNTPGTIDAGYRGEVGVVLINHHRSENFLVKPGMRIAQLVIAKVERAIIQEISRDEFTDPKLYFSGRGGGGFGSTGVMT